MVIFIMLIVVLLPHAVCDAQIVNCAIGHPQYVHHKYDQPGDFVIGGIVFQNVFQGERTTFNQNPPQPQLASMFIQNYQHVLAFEFAIKEINENRQLLPNISLGFSLYDSYLEARWTYCATLQLISPKNRVVPNYKCDKQGSLMAVAEELTSDFSHQVPEVLGSYKIPQVLIGSAAILMDQNQAPFVYRGEPNGGHQYRGILQLLLHFKWTWIGFIAADELNLQWFMEVMFQEFSKHGICFAFLESFSSLPDESGTESPVIKFYNKIMNHKISVLVFYGDIRSMLCLRRVLNTERKGSHYKPKGKVWILTAQMEFRYSSSFHNQDIQDFHGTLSFATHSNELQGFQAFLQNRNLSTNAEDGFIKDFWENAFQCTFSSSPPGNTERATCTGEQKLESLPEYIFPMSITGPSYTIYNAVYALAHALHAMYMAKSKNWVQMDGEKWKRQTEQPWQLHHFLKRVSFNNSAGDLISFDQNGELVAEFDIINWVTFPNQTMVKVKVGRLDPQAPADEAISISEHAIVWPIWFNQARPLSVCNNNCYPGYSKKMKEGEPFCCYDCVPCPEGTVADQKDMVDCFTCPGDHYPNKDQTSCIPKVVVFLSYEEPLGIGLAICALSFSLVTALVLRLFMKHHDNPIVKVNNRSLTYTILMSLLLCFLCPLVYIGQPTKMTCILRGIAFDLGFTMVISSVLAKTFTVVLAFTATQPGSKMKKWVAKRLSNSIILPCFVIQAVICTVCLISFPPRPDTDMHSKTEEILLECNKSSPIILYCEQVYLIFLALVSFAVAFHAQKLPDVFNEAKFITISMLMFCSVWLSFVPTYWTARGLNQVAAEIFSILVSCAALLSFMFFPKCYIILWRPQLNIREQLRKKKHCRS